MSYIFVTEQTSNQSVAINSNNVNMVKELRIGSQIVFVDNSVIYVSDEYLDLVARLKHPGF